MSPFAGPLFAAAALLGAAGAFKVASPAATRVALRTAGGPGQAWVVRVLGAVEIAIAVAALMVGGALAAALVSLSYAGFAAFAFVLARRTQHQAPCGCFGSASAPVGNLHVVINLVAAALTAGAIANPPDGLTQAIADTPLGGLPFFALVALMAWTAYLSLTLLPELQVAASDQGGPA